MKEPQIIFKAELHPKVLTYQALVNIAVLIITVVGIVFIPFWLIAWYGKYRGVYTSDYSIALTDTGVFIRRGSIFKSETNIPLNRVTDVTVYQGPVMRMLGIHGVTVETAGQTKLAGAANLVGVIDSHEFRRQVLERIEIYKASQGASAPAVSSTPAKPVVDEQTGLLKDILETLKRIEKQSK